MSYIVEIRPQCDICSYINCDMMYKTREECRRAMVGDGWKVGKKDICPACVEEPNPNREV